MAETKKLLKSTAIDADLHYRVKLLAVQRKVTVREMLEALLKTALKRYTV